MVTAANRPDLRHLGAAQNADEATSLKPDGYVRFREPWAVRLMNEIGAQS